MFIRFVVGGDEEHHRLLTGLVTEARLLRDRGELAEYETERLEETYEWFNANLPCPPYSSSGWSRDAVSWFKDSAKESIQRMRELAVLLESNGFIVRMLRSENPGKVLYEIAIKWSSRNGEHYESHRTPLPA
jgi:hypothetical protein